MNDSAAPHRTTHERRSVRRSARLAALGAAAFALLITVAPGAVRAQTTSAGTAIDAQRMLADLRSLAHDSMSGRRTGTPGAEAARRYIEAAFTRSGLRTYGDAYQKPFELAGRDGTVRAAANVVGYLTGRSRPDRAIVITAHFDHLGERDGQIFNGADDNASGVAAMLELARMFAADPPAHTIVFAALDAEESGLRGARAFVADPPLPLERIALNVNLDMVGRNEAGELWVAGTAHTPALLPFIEAAQPDAHVTLRIGHDRPGTGGDDWTGASDHGAFHARGVPFLYFGVEDHADYHKESDEAKGIEPGFYGRAVQTIADLVRALDRRLDTLLPPRAR